MYNLPNKDLILEDKALPDFFIINRSLTRSDFWLEEKFTRPQAWIDLIGLAQYHDSSIRIRGIKISVKRGQLAWSQLRLSQRWQWSRDKVRHFLKELEEDHMIRQQNNEVTTLITIIKYNIYQGDEQQTSHQTRQQKNIKPDNKPVTYNKGNKVKKEKNNIYRSSNDDRESPFNSFWNEYPRKIGKKKALDVWKRKKLNTHLEEIVTFVKAARETKQWKDGFVPHPTTFLNGERWTDDLSAYGGGKDSRRGGAFTV